ncbi:MAG: hypothetical protein WDA03_08275 [Trueperaceae bacterium]
MSDQTQAQAFQTADHNITDVLAAVEAGTISVGDALKQEEERGEEARSSLLEKLRAIINPPTNDPPAPKASGKVKVRVNPKRGVTGIAYYDPEQKVTVSEKPVTVERTAFIKQRLLSGELVEA